MGQHKKDILASLATIMGTVSGVNTVVRTYKDIDITQFSEADLPLIEIREPEEAPHEELTSMRQVMLLDTELKVWFVTWGENPTSTYETLYAAIRNAVGDDFTLTGEILACWVETVSAVEGECPLYSFELGLRMKYYLSLKGV